MKCYLLKTIRLTIIVRVLYTCAIYIRIFIIININNVVNNDIRIMFNNIAVLLCCIINNYVI